jgi:hypothetical protein
MKITYIWKEYDKGIIIPNYVVESYLNPDYALEKNAYFCSL